MHRFSRDPTRDPLGGSHLATGSLLLLLLPAPSLSSCCCCCSPCSSCTSNTHCLITSAVAAATATQGPCQRLDERPLLLQWDYPNRLRNQHTKLAVALLTASCAPTIGLIPLHLLVLLFLLGTPPYEPGSTIKQKEWAETLSKNK